ncbi:MAG: hypothetical protein PHU93_04555 [Candidatus Gracilibacteria bacterium]|nr:hypothetical protein [Candidatus Gracilibacteria bacterium]
MNNLQQAALRIVPQPEVFDIPKDYRERGIWFGQEFGDTLKSHLQNLCRFCDHVPKNQGISYTDIQDGYVLAHYGRFSIYFPIEKITSKVSALDWMNQYILEVDNVEVPLDTGIQEVQDEIQQRTARSLETSGQRLINKLLPERITFKNTEITSKHVVIKRSLRIKKR